MPACRCRSDRRSPALLGSRTCVVRLDDGRGRRDSAPVRRRRPQASPRRVWDRQDDRRAGAAECRGDDRSLLAIAAAHEIVAGVVGWVDLTAADVDVTLAEVAALPGGHKLVGIRHQVHDEADPRWLLREDVQRGLTRVAESGLVFELLVRTRELPSLDRDGCASSVDDLRGGSSCEASDPIRRRSGVVALHGGAERIPERCRQALGPRHRGRLEGLDT